MRGNAAAVAIVLGFFGLAGVAIYSRDVALRAAEAASRPDDVVIVGPDVETAFRPAIFVTCRDGFSVELEPRGDGIRVACAKAGH